MTCAAEAETCNDVLPYPVIPVTSTPNLDPETGVELIPPVVVTATPADPSAAPGVIETLPGGVQHPTLPRTGADLATKGSVGLVVVLLGVALVQWSRRAATRRAREEVLVAAEVAVDRIRLSDRHLPQG